MLRYYLSKIFLINHTYVTTKSMSNPHAINTMSKRNQTPKFKQWICKNCILSFYTFIQQYCDYKETCTLGKFKFISNNQFYRYIMVHFARGMKQTTIINSNDSRQSVCFYINYVYSTFLHMYTQYIYPSSHIHDTDRPNKRICKTTPYLKKYASFSNTQELHLLYLNHI